MNERSLFIGQKYHHYGFPLDYCFFNSVLLKHTCFVVRSSDFMGFTCRLHRTLTMIRWRCTFRRWVSRFCCCSWYWCRFCSSTCWSAWLSATSRSSRRTRSWSAWRCRWGRWIPFGIQLLFNLYLLFDHPQHNLQSAGHGEWTIWPMYVWTECREGP